MRTAARRRMELSPSWDGLQSTERWRSSVASRASQRSFGMPRATVPKAKAWRHGKAKHRREMSDKEAEHQKEVSFLKSIIQKAKKWFPLFQELVYMERFCLKVGFNERQTATLISGKPLFYEGELYSEEHKRKFKTERAGSQVVKDPTNRSKLALAINGQLIGEWFKEQFDRLFSSIKRTVEPLRRGKGMGL